MSRLAWVTSDRQIAVAEADGSNPNLLTMDVAVGGAGWTGLARSQHTWTWPTWSPDGQWVAAFVVEPADERSGPVRVVSSSVDGVHQEQWLEVAAAAPIYLRWHSSGEALAVLLQRGKELVLEAVDHTELGRGRLVGEGVPLFFTWAPRGGRVVVHSAEGVGQPGRLMSRDPFGTGEDAAYPLEAGNFCAPVVVGDEVVWASSHPEGSIVQVSGTDGSAPRALLQRKGLLALVAAPGARPWVAVSSAPRGEGTPYAGIERVDVQTGEVRTLTTMRCLAYFWAPAGDWLLVAEVVPDENCLRWWKVPAEPGPAVDLGTFWPTRDLVFYLHFFDQFTGSHPLISRDGRWITYAGYPAGGGMADLSEPPRVYVKDTMDPAEPAREVDGGTFSVFSP